MFVSESWLREWVNPQLDTQQLARKLTMAGLEVGAIESAAPPFSGVVIGRVEACVAHPNADKLRVCTVDVGADDPLSIVCGAPNVRAGLYVAVAMVGAQLPGDFKIRKTKLRGEPSLGMICSARELGLGDEHDGILELPDGAPVGDDFRVWLDLDDQILELELTPNRGDCLGMAGVAREVGALCRERVSASPVAQVAATSDREFAVRLSAPDGCPRYVGRVVSGIDPTARTPLWMRERLRRAGIRSLGPVVDVTNYVLVETGQPMHGFDLAQLNGYIDVRYAHSNERLTLLDGRDIELGEDVLVIADAERALALAGIMGGVDSGVTEATRDVFFESAFFAPGVIAGRARRYGLHTDASHRFERGVDPAGQVAAIERATQLLMLIAGGQAGPVTDTTRSEALPASRTVALREARLALLLGTTIERQRVDDIFARLGFGVMQDGAGWKVTAPSFRFDIERPEDLVEEVARVHGYDRIPQHNETAALTLRPATETRVRIGRVKDALVDRGYQEVITYSFIDPQQHEIVCPDETALPLANPISADLAVMRTSLWPGLLATLRYNLARQHARLRIFEYGLTFVTQNNELQQKNKIALALCGGRLGENWAHDSEPVDVHDLVGDLESVIALNGAGASLSVRNAQHPALHPGQSARLYRGDTEIGWLGALHPERARQLDIDSQVFLAQLDVDGAFAADVPRMRAISRYPAVRRDISVIVDDHVAVGEMLSSVRAAAPDSLRDLRVFDVYRGKAVDSGRKSVSLGLILQDSSRTLNDTQADAAVHSVVAQLKRDFNGKIRD